MTVTIRLSIGSGFTRDVSRFPDRHSMQEAQATATARSLPTGTAATPGKSLLMTRLCFLLLAILGTVFQVQAASAQAQEWQVGLTAARNPIRAFGVNAADAAAPTVLVIAGLDGPGTASNQAEDLLEQYAAVAGRNRTVNLLVIALANPDAESLVFPPDGQAYAENPVSHALWRWIGLHAPDLALVIGADNAGLMDALAGQPAAGLGTVPARRLDTQAGLIDQITAFDEIGTSPAHQELLRRLDRSPAQLAAQLAETYGYDFSTPAYVPGMGLIGRMRLGHMDEVGALLDPYLRGKEVIVNNPSVMAGQLVFAEYAERSGDRQSLELVMRAADLAFDEQGALREVMPFHAEMSDSVFMAPPLLAKAGKLTGNTVYFDMAARHVIFMQDLLLREDGLYDHSPLTRAAWSRGNAFPALGLALLLSDFPEAHPAFAGLLESYRSHLQALLPFQDVDGLWREVIDYPGSFPELSSTAMIGFAIRRGIDRGWLDAATYQPVLERAWRAVKIRTSSAGEFVDVCTSTGKQQSLDAYLDRPAIFGRDDRAGGMVMNFANEMAGKL